VADLSVFDSLGQPNLLIRTNRQLAARYGVLPGDVNSTVLAAIGGQAVTQVLDGDRRFDVVVRFLPQYRSTIEAIGNIPVSTADGGNVPLRQVAEISKQTGASFVYREDNTRYIPVKFSVRGRDLQSTIAEAEAKIRQQITLPSGYHYEWAGEFQELQAAVQRLLIVVPVSLVLIFFLLYGTFGNLRDAALLIGTVPPRSDRRPYLLTRHPYQFQYLSGGGVHLAVWCLRTGRRHPGLTYQAAGARRLASRRSDSTGSRATTPTCPDGCLSCGYWPPAGLGSDGYRLGNATTTGACGRGWHGDLGGAHPAGITGHVSSALSA